jgi:hypothetical protein
MTISENDKLVLQGRIQRNYNVAAKPELCYDYLSDIRVLLAQVPYVTRVQVGKVSGRARAFFNIRVLSVGMDAVLDMEPVYYPEEHTIRIKTAEEPLGAVPAGHVTGNFNALLKLIRTEKGNTKIAAQIALALDGSQLIDMGVFGRPFIETSGQRLFQEFAERMCDDYALNLLEDFRKWQTKKK